MSIQVKNLSFSYKDNVVIKNISLNFEKGNIYGLLGLNGSGKTTLLKLILGILKGKEGEILINGINSKDFKENDISKFISYVPQGLNITYDITVFDFILMGFNPFLKYFEKPNREHEKIAYEQLSQMGLSHLINKNLTALSGGELQMILITRALIQNTDFIIMDEPVSNLDLKNQKYIMDRIKEMSILYRKSIIISLHDPNLIKNYCNNAILLKNGKVITQGNANDVINKKNLELIYEMPFEIMKTSNGNPYYIG